ncbi:MAG: type II toxin-antitoxin system VapC family toxin [Saprospirales bacterium]|jgi:tRNA(fMet)-specific endonuclease VapC|nr:type II toxin-antitoxin system VapC family toxin [Saprospirales bacterium]MBK7336018.1 type II toxin-antitoxin system VapC family toxin [Saprospirales bacterium]
MNYLLDTDICVFFLRGKHNLHNKIEKAGKENCFISEITLAELKFGVETSENPEKHRVMIKDFEREFQILPIFSALDIYAAEKARLKKAGKLIDDFDLLIGSTSIANGLILVTNNEAHLGRLQNVRIENWAK